MRDYFHWDRYLNELEKDCYPQPQRGDDHLKWAENAIAWIDDFGSIKDVLDVGCGEGFCQEFFERSGIEYRGTTLTSEDWVYAKEKNRNVHLEDFNFINANGNSYDLIFARHALEHSFAPILTLMEWHRVAKKYLVLVMPTPAHWGEFGRNHYSVASIDQIKFWCNRAGWAVEREHQNAEEFWLQCRKIERGIPFYED